MLAGIGLVWNKKSTEKWYWLLLLGFAFLLALGPRLYLTPQNPTEFTLPYRWLYDMFAPLRALRAPIRFDVLINFALAGLAGMGAIVILAKSRATMRSDVIGLGIIGLIALEYLSIPAAHTEVLPVASQVPALYAWLAQQPPGSAWSCR